MVVYVERLTLSSERERDPNYSDHCLRWHVTLSRFVDGKRVNDTFDGVSIYT
jgi:hypothetical protein